MNKVKIAWFGKHFGEEPPLVGNKKQGAGAIFFSNCNLKCVFCQNYQISQGGLGQEYSVEELAGMMLELQKQNAVNIDLVSPTIWWKQAKEAIMLAKEKGLNIPIVWNSNAYEAVPILKSMDGLVDIYLPDFKYGDDQIAQKYSGAIDYVKVALGAVKEMLRQAGHLKFDDSGLAKRGVIVRHLILPNNVENSLKALQLIHYLDPQIYFSLMNQYYPIFQADQFPELNRPVSQKEFEQVFERMWQLGLTNGWAQDEGSRKILIPDFNKDKPFG